MVESITPSQEEIRIVEALLFSSPEPLTQAKVNTCFDNNPPSLNEIASILKQEYEGENYSYTLEKVAGGFCILTKPQYEYWIKRLRSRQGKTSLSRASLEVLSIVAFKKKITRSEVEAIRGVDSGSALSTLLDRNLLKIIGRSDGPGRPLLYSISEKFLINFGLASLEDLPKLKEIKELNIATAEVGENSEENPIR